MSPIWIGIGVLGLIVVVVLAVLLIRQQNGMREVTSSLGEQIRLIGELVQQTHRVADSSRQLVQQHEAFVTEHLRLVAYPHLKGTFQSFRGGYKLVLTNPGHVPAFQAHAVLIAEYAAAAFEPRSFADLYLRHGDTYLLNGNGLAFLYERHYETIPCAKRTEYVLNLPQPPTTVWLYLQFSDSNGRSYAQLCRFIQEDEHGLVYKASAPNETATPLPRTQLVEVQGTRHLVPQGSLQVSVGADGEISVQPVEQEGQSNAVDLLPSHAAAGEFIDLLSRSIPNRYLKREHATSIDRDQWSDVVHSDN